MRVLRAPTLVCSLLTMQHTVAFLTPVVRVQSSCSRSRWASNTASSSGSETAVPRTTLRAAEGSRDHPLDADVKDRGVDSKDKEVLREAGQAWAGAALDLVGSAVDALITTATKKDDDSGEPALLSSLTEPQSRGERSEDKQDQHSQRDSEDQRDDVRARHGDDVAKGQRYTEPSRDEDVSERAPRGESTQDRPTTHTESHVAGQGFAAGQGFETLRAERQKDEEEDAGQGSIVAEGDELTAAGKTVTEWMEEAAPRAFEQNAESDSSSRVGPPLPETSPDKFNPTPPTAGLKATHTTSGIKPGRITSAQPAPPS